MRRLAVSRQTALAAAIVLSLGSTGAVCGGDDDSSMGTGNAGTDLAGDWCLVKTLVTATNDYPAGTQFPVELHFEVSGDQATMSTPGVAGTAPGSLSGGVWTFYYESQLAPGLTSKNQIQVISTAPFKGTEDHKFYDAYGQQIESEAATLAGNRKSGATCW